MNNRIFKLILFFLLLCTYSFGADDINVTLNRAINLLENRYPDSAAVILYELAESVENTENRIRVLYYLSLAMKQLGRFEEQIYYIRNAYETDPGSEFADDVRLEYAMVLLNRGEIEASIELTQEFKENYSSSPLLPDILYITGEAWLSKGEYQRAFNSFTDIIKSFPYTKAASEAVMKEGICLYKLDLISGAIERFEHYLIETPDGNNTDNALYYLGFAFERTRQPELAVEVFKRLTIEFPSFPKVIEVFFKLGENYFAISRYFESENAFSNYIFNADESENNYDEALFYLERIKFRTGEYSQETDIAENFIAQYPKSPRSPKLIFDLARYYRIAGNLGKSIEKYNVLLNNPLFSVHADSAAILKADTYVEFDRRKDAEDFLKQFAYEGTDSVRTQRMFLKLGSLNESWEKYDNAIAWYDSTLEYDVSMDISFNALWSLGRIYKILNRRYESAKTFERIISEYPNHMNIINVYTELADIYFLQGRNNDAIKIAEKSLEISEGNRKTDILFFLAKLYEDIDEEHAFNIYQLIYNNPENSPKQHAEAYLYYGDLALKKGDVQSALKAYSNIINSTADSLWILKAKNRISDIK